MSGPSALLYAVRHVKWAQSRPVDAAGAARRAGVSRPLAANAAGGDGAQRTSRVVSILSTRSRCDGFAQSLDAPGWFGALVGGFGQLVDPANNCYHCAPRPGCQTGRRRGAINAAFFGRQAGNYGRGSATAARRGAGRQSGAGAGPAVRPSLLRRSLRRRRSVLADEAAGQVLFHIGRGLCGRAQTARPDGTSCRAARTTSACRTRLEPGQCQRCAQRRRQCVHVATTMGTCSGARS